MRRINKWKYILYFLEEEYSELISRNIIEMLYTESFKNFLIYN